MDYIVRSPSTPSSRNHNDLFLHTPPSGASNGSTDDTSADVSAELHLPSRSRSRSPGFLNIPDGSDCRSRSRSPFSLPSPSTIRPPSPCSSKSSPCTPHSEPRGGPSEFSVSTILPNFLYLGPEISTVEQAQKLKAMGVKRILNMAIECEDGLGLEGMFEKYKKIPMRDHVEEDNIVKGMREVCHFLDDARLHSSPTFVHCKAGKSRSVTAVIAYLIHANHWDRDRAYNFISGRRKGISPNIGFMSELMNFEKEELCGKGFAAGRGNESPVAASTATDTGSGDSAESGSAPTAEHNVSEATVSRTGPQLRRLAHIRDSLPPKLYQNNSSSAVPGSAVDGLGTSLVDHAEETEVKDAEGRYRHARRAPVDEFTLQPMRRVSKAGLESASWN
ncbi:protein-tyrosine phosphatase-like protein [Cantharellus anzutake]|uniref:protein-tyrosine phosphatase-like protein n=1 Tax=Cantharellus anzutake TaxID=1750568 RepID=UPI001903F400|nr:protein-tyrosine phosphatase-like protein [Cantharellus anzutake]KAF8335943.1 protein-tyrosine phosphatase-like protein [Cantharellus anzutake]